MPQLILSGSAEPSHVLDPPSLFTCRKRGDRVRRAVDVFGACCCALALAVSGCEAPSSRDTIVIGLGTEPETLLPVVEASAIEGEINGLLYLALNSARWGDGKLEYVSDALSLSEGWQFSPDSLVLTYDLRRDAVWTDGQPVDAEDVVFTFELVRNPDIGSAAIAAWDNLDSIVAVDDHRVSFYFARRYPGMLFDTGLRVIPKHIFEDTASTFESLVAHRSLTEGPESLVVNGPYRVAEWRRGERLVLEANPAASGSKPPLARVVFRMLTEESTRRLELENGNLDAINPISPERASEIAAQPDFRFESMQDRFYDYVAWNGFRFEPFQNPTVRRALSLAIDREAILAGLRIADHARLAGGPYPPIFTGLSDPAVKPDPFLPDSASNILAGLGWSDGDGDGVLERDGQPFRFTLLTNNGNQRREQAAEMIQAQLADIGVDVTISLVELNTLLGTMFETRDFEAVLMGWQVGLDPGYLVGQFWPPDHVLNVMGYASAALDTIIPLAQTASTAEEAAPHWRAAARRIAHDRPYAFLWFFDDLIVLNQRVGNTRIDTYGMFQNLHEWTIGE